MKVVTHKIINSVANGRRGKCSLCSPQNPHVYVYMCVVCVRATCMQVCLFVCVCVCVCVCVNQVCMYTYVHTNMFVYILLCPDSSSLFFWGEHLVKP